MDFARSNLLCSYYGEVANLLRTCYGETGVMDFGLNISSLKILLTRTSCCCTVCYVNCSVKKAINLPILFSLPLFFIESKILLLAEC